LRYEELIVRADGELRVIRCVGVPGVENGVAVRCEGTLVDITEREQRRRSFVAARRIASKRRRSVTPAASDETFRILEDDRSVNRHSISFERIHPEDLSSARPSVRTIGSELPMSYARTCCANTMEVTRTFMYLLIGI
jgi:hypothetical protein